MTIFTRTSPAGGTLPAGVTEIGGLVLDIVGVNDVRVVSQLAASSLFVGFYGVNPGPIGTQTGLATAIAALGGGIASLSVRMTLLDGDTGAGDFDDGDNTFLLNGFPVGNFSAVATQATDSLGTTVFTEEAGFRDNSLNTGFFFTDDAAVLEAIYDSIVLAGQVDFAVSDVDFGENYYDFTAGVDGGLVDVGTPPNISPLAADDAASTTENTAVMIDVGDNDTDPDGTIASYSFTQPANGVLSGGGSIVTYTPNSGFIGTDTFTYTVTDDKGATDMATVTITVDGEEPPITLCPTVDRAGTQDGSGSGNDILTGPAFHNSFYFDNATGDTGDDRITNFDKDDVLVVSEALRDGNGDGVISYGTNAVLDLGGGDTVRFANGVRSLRFLGEACEGNFVYAAAYVRPTGAIEGRVLTDDVLTGDAGDAKADVFFFDTALDLDLGADAIIDFGARDILVTTTKIRDGNDDGIIRFGANARLDLPGGAGGPGDPGTGIEGGSVSLTSTAGSVVNALEYDGTITSGGVLYYVYSALGSTAGVDTLG